MNNTVGQTNRFEDLVVDQPAEKDPVFASYLTHELRAPVTAIRLGLEIFQEQVNARLAADERQMLALAVKNTGRLQGLVNDILDYAKIMSGKMGFKKEACDSRQLIVESLEGMQALAISKGIRLVKTEGEPLPRVMAEPRRIVQILTNLISNAIKFTPARGSITVSVVEGVREHRGTLVFKVKDTGCGIPQKDLVKIFDCFNQSAHNGKQGEGTGLGLTLARLMVELHQGRIWAESWRGLGATFYFTVPIAMEDLAQKIPVYPRPVEFHGLFVDLYRRVNAVIAAFL